MEKEQRNIEYVKDMDGIQHGDYCMFLDDIRSPRMAFYVVPDPRYMKLDWVIVRDWKQFIDCIKQNGIPKLAAFDHDLADEHYYICTTTEWVNYHQNGATVPTGYSCASYLVGYCKKHNVPVPPFIVHTQSMVGRKAINYILETGEKYMGV